jgi:hypothetical protein
LRNCIRNKMQESDQRTTLPNPKKINEYCLSLVR